MGFLWARAYGAHLVLFEIHVYVYAMHKPIYVLRVYF